MSPETKKFASPYYFHMYDTHTYETHRSLDTHREETLIRGGRGLASDWRVVPELCDASKITTLISITYHRLSEHLFFRHKGV